jgi:hypothetical protein
MGWVNTLGEMAESTRDSISSIKNTDLDPTVGQMEESMWESG